jgi:hypothetical protein
MIKAPTRRVRAATMQVATAIGVVVEAGDRSSGRAPEEVPLEPPRGAGEQRPGDNAVKCIERPAPIPASGRSDCRSWSFRASGDGCCEHDLSTLATFSRQRSCVQSGEDMSARGSNCERKGRYPVEIC